MTSDTKWTIGTMIVVGLGLAGLMVSLHASTSERIDRLGESLRIDIRAVNERIDAVLLADRGKQQSQ